MNENNKIFPFICQFISCTIIVSSIRYYHNNNDNEKDEKKRSIVMRLDELFLLLLLCNVPLYSLHLKLLFFFYCSKSHNKELNRLPKKKAIIKTFKKLRISLKKKSDFFRLLFDS